jgi:hypothetical protein
MPAEWERLNTPAPAASLPLAGRHVLLATTNPAKVQEYATLLSKYAVAVAQAPPALAEDGAARAAALAAPGCLAVLVDSAELLGADGAPADLARTGLAEARVSLRAWFRDQEGGAGAGAAPAFAFTDVTQGFIDPGLAVPALHRAAGVGVFGYDDVFVPLATGVSYHAASQRQAGGGKVSSRVTVASELVRRLLHFKALVDLKHAPLSPHASIDFATDVTDFVEAHPLLSRGLAVPGYGAVLRAVLNGGLFLKAPGNKRERNFWWPGLNAGLPLTPKGDAVHEATYAAHDFGHFLVPDLLWTGSPLCVSRLGRRVYLVHRMLSEAVTMVLADMLYAEGLRRQGVAYDYGKRRIWPLLAAAEAHTGRSLLGAAGDALDCGLLHDLIAANAAFALCGDAAPYEALVGAAGAPALDAYKAKYAPFFVADYAWTAANVAHMAARAASFGAWWADAGAPLRALDAGVAASTPTVDEWVAHLAAAEPEACGEAAGADGELPPAQRARLVRACLGLVWARVLAPALRAPPAPARPRAARLFRAFLRYSMGQHAVFVDHAECRLARPVRSALVGALARAAAAGGELTLPEVAALRGLYAAFISALARRELAISGDDEAVFPQVYPLFEPVYVAYLLPGASSDAELAAAAARALV